MARAEGDAVLNHLFAHLRTPEFQIRHQWREGDVVVIYGTPEALEHAEAVLLAG